MIEKTNKLEKETGKKVIEAIENKKPRNEVLNLFKKYCNTIEGKTDNSMYCAIYNKLSDYFIK
jgi:hypothetical protein